MLSPEESAELRELQRKAYAPGAEPSDADAARLRALEERRVAPPAPADSSRGGDDEGSAVAESPVDGAASPGAAPAHAAGGTGEEVDRAKPAEHEAHAPEEQAARPRWRRWVPYAAIGLALLVGFGVGFAVFGQTVVRSIALSLAVGAEQAELEASDDYDPGSITAVGQAHGVTIWHATRGEGAEQCVIVTHDAGRDGGCATSAEFEDRSSGLYASVILSGDGDEAGAQLSVSLARTVDGELAVIAEVWTQDMWDWRSQYTEDELAILERIERETGVDGGVLQIVGYDDTTPVWLEYSGVGVCAIVVAEDVERACADDPAAPVVLEVRAADGGVTAYHVSESSMRGPVLTIERTPAVVDVTIDDTTGDVDG
ncbi:hypothetical protein [Microbacterium sp. CIAB417]|uniref:hypothetical protein n=1 Tax=Microbacterium sp. CIAB417 TaxID=2860287 RepID=UPI001FAD2BB5|nr:hypothetical protein [Microbacterium sp. CIAB417]